MSQQPEEQQVRIKVVSDNIKTSYANIVQTHATTEEILLTFGINQTVPSQEAGVSAEMTVQFSDRIILNHYTTKRLALSLLQVVREHEERFGVIELDANKRVNTQLDLEGQTDKKQ